MKGQMTIEFMVLLSVLIVMSTLFIFGEMSLRERSFNLKAGEEIEKLCERAAFEINAAVRFGDSYTRSFYIDETLFGVSDFDILVSDYAVFIDWDKGSKACIISTKNITGEIKKGWNLIENIDGVIYVT
jgi:hypothetical protein